jgi:membrane protein required for colicin V production
MLDIFIVVVMLWAIIKGWRSGFLREFASLLGFIIGLLVASLLYSSLGEYLAPKLGSSPTIGNVFAFLILWIAVPIALGIGMRGLTSLVRGIPFVGNLNGLLGTVISCLKYLILLSCLVNVMAFIHIIDDKKSTQDSVLYQPTKKFVGWAFSKAQSMNSDTSSGKADSMSEKGNPIHRSERSE